MDVLTKPHNWIELQQRPTADLLRVWETRDLDIWSKELIHDVHQVLVSRNVINTATNPQIKTWDEILGMPVGESFMVTQIIRGKKDRRWLVNLFEDHALFFCQENSDEFSIGRKKSHKEFIFQRSGVLLLQESSVARIKGMLFDFSGSKERILSWMPELTKGELKQTQHIWGVVLLIAGVFTFLLPTLINPAWASALIGLGLLYLLFSNRVLFLINGSLLIYMGVVNVFTFLNNFNPSANGAVNDHVFCAGFCICLIFLGFTEVWKFSKFIDTK